MRQLEKKQPIVTGSASEIVKETAFLFRKRRSESYNK